MKADLQKHTLHLRSGDWDFIEAMFKPNGIATSVVVRTLISNYVDKKRREMNQTSFTHPSNEINIDLE